MSVIYTEKAWWGASKDFKVETQREGKPKNVQRYFLSVHGNPKRAAKNLVLKDP